MDAVWEALHGARGWGKYPAEHLIQTVMRAHRDPELRRQTQALELGCGGGANLTFLLREGFQVTAIDGSPSAVDNARALTAPLVAPGQRCEISACYFEDLDFPDDSFDLAVDYLALYANPVAVIHAALAKVHRMVRPGGRFYSRVWGRETQGAQSGVMIEPGTSQEPQSGPCAGMGVSHFFDEAELRALYADWSDLTLWRLTTQDTATPETFIEEWVVWATK